MECNSCITLSFKGLRSTQIRINPDGFGTTTMAAHHCVGSFTWDIIPSLSICCISSLTFSRNGSGMFLGVNRQNGLASGYSLIVYSPLNIPSQENSFGYCSGMLWVMAFMPVMISSALMTGKPNKLLVTSETTVTVSPGEKYHLPFTQHDDED